MSAATADTPNSSIMANFGSPIALESPCDSIEVNHELETNPIEVEVNGLQNESTVGCLPVLHYFLINLIFVFFIQIFSF